MQLMLNVGRGIEQVDGWWRLPLIHYRQTGHIMGRKIRPTGGRAIAAHTSRMGQPAILHIS
jgi:hypothetical protein